ncbi:MAG: hypothetical protein J6333_09475 [Planctomycetes bacterium]|nr:hypothetical protein [Planctomycetota bacterium]
MAADENAPANAPEGGENGAELDIFEVCRKVLEGLLAKETPEQVQQKLVAMGVPEGDVPQLINITVLSAQAASPVIEQRSTPAEAVKALVSQGMDERMATAMVNMIINVMAERAEEKVQARGDAGGGEAIGEDAMKLLMRLAQAIAVDIQNGGDAATMAAAIRNIEGIGAYPQVAGREEEFIEEVRLALKTAERAQAISLPQAIDELGVRERPAYVAVLALFFLRLHNQAVSGQGAQGDAQAGGQAEG